MMIYPSPPLFSSFFGLEHNWICSIKLGKYPWGLGMLLSSKWRTHDDDDDDDVRNGGKQEQEKRRKR